MKGNWRLRMELLLQRFLPGFSDLTLEGLAEPPITKVELL